MLDKVMNASSLQELLDQGIAAKEWLWSFGLTDFARGYHNLAALASHFPADEARAAWFARLAPMISWSADPDMVLNNLERFVTSLVTTPNNSAPLLKTLQDQHALATLLEILSTSQYLSDILIRESSLFATVRENEGRPLPRAALIRELVTTLASLTDDREILRCLRQFKRRHTLRVAYGDIIRRQSLEIVTEQISDIADACVEGALRVAGRRLYARRGTPKTLHHDIARFTVLALGKLGGRELNYSSDIDLMFLYDAEGTTDATAITNAQYFAELGREIVRLLSEVSELGFVYRVDMRLRPNGHHAPLAIGFDEAVRYYDTRGRTWERQAFLKARPIAGNMGLGNEFLGRLQYWIYPPYLGQMDIAGIRSLKRKIERNADAEEVAGAYNVKTGRGGIRDVEFAIQFLQLIHGYSLHAVRSPNTLHAIEALERAGCLSHQERTILSESYKFLRKVEHRLQMMFDLQTHSLPAHKDELRKLALRMGYAKNASDPLKAFCDEYRRKTELNRRILDHLFHAAFRRDQQTAAEVDLIFDPDPTPEMINRVLQPYRFQDTGRAYRHLIDLAEERVRYFSSRRSRHFLASIAAPLLSAVATTPDPDATLATLASVTDALGGKAGLWELFSFSLPSLQLYVKLCAFAPYLTDMLRRDPGTLDGLMDSLVRQQLPRRSQLDDQLAFLVAGAAGNITPILHSFKNDSVLCAGVRDILGLSDVRESTATLSDIAQVCLKQIAMAEYGVLVKRHGEPMCGTAVSRFAIVGLGKFGGREINYHSDLDLLFLYEGEGTTQLKPLERTLFNPEEALVPRTEVTNQLFFETLVQHILRRAESQGVAGKLYSIDLRLRPLGNQGKLVTTVADFVQHFTTGTGSVWERLMLCRARVVVTLDESQTHLGVVEDVASKSLTLSSMRRMVNEAVVQAQYTRQWEASYATEIREMRKKMEESDPRDQIKRGPGGLVDIEFLVQTLQLKDGERLAGIRNPNTPASLEKLAAAGLISDQDRDTLRRRYRFLRTIESGLRLLDAESTDRLPDATSGLLVPLATMLNIATPELLVAQVATTREEIRQIFSRLFNHLASAASP